MFRGLSSAEASIAGSVSSRASPQAHPFSAPSGRAAISEDHEPCVLDTPRDHLWDTNESCPARRNAEGERASRTSWPWWWRCSTSARRGPHASGTRPAGSATWCRWLSCTRAAPIGVMSVPSASSSGRSRPLRSCSPGAGVRGRSGRQPEDVGCRRGASRQDTRTVLGPRRWGSRTRRTAPSRSETFEASLKYLQKGELDKAIDRGSPDSGLSAEF